MHNIYGDFKLHLTDELACFLVNKYCIKRVLSFRDIMVAQVVFCQNLCLWLFIGQKKCFETILWLKTQERHAVTALFLHLPWFLSYLQHCPKTENWLMIKRYHWVLQRKWNNWVLPSRYGVSVDIFETKYNKNSVVE